VIFFPKRSEISEEDIIDPSIPIDHQGISNDNHKSGEPPKKKTKKSVI